MRRAARRSAHSACAITTDSWSRCARRSDEGRQLPLQHLSGLVYFLSEYLRLSDGLSSQRRASFHSLFTGGGRTVSDPLRELIDAAFRIGQRLCESLVLRLLECNPHHRDVVEADEREYRFEVRFEEVEMRGMSAWLVAARTLGSDDDQRLRGN